MCTLAADLSDLISSSGMHHVSYKGKETFLQLQDKFIVSQYSIKVKGQTLNQTSKFSRYGPNSGNGDNSNDDDFDYLIYATFSTPVNSIGGSAVCAFRLRDITNVFNGHFKEQRDMSANWQPVPDHKVSVKVRQRPSDVFHKRTIMFLIKHTYGFYLALH